MKRFGGQPGVTLIETIIYVAVLGLLAATLVTFALTVQSLGSKNYAFSEVVASAEFAMDTMERLIRESEGVVIPARGATTTSLELDMPGTNDSTFLTLSNGVLQMTEGVGTPVPVSLSTTEITSLSFTNLAHARAQDTIQISFDMAFRDAGSIEFMHSATFTTTVRVRQ